MSHRPSPINKQFFFVRFYFLACSVLANASNPALYLARARLSRAVSSHSVHSAPTTMEPMETFACFEVMKNPQIEKDLERFQQHLTTCFP